ncbi:hypothetical protein HNP88_000374 [Methanococcus maripaludis]|uniref:Uncharacterized protein n=1 Tax=Methanococcus maripaludis TaxID=39152 RepID=A0A7J9NMD5_METMI|nr:hypothetical protein [Methanococcus maripaludis]MBA2846190.1 hypothetical protein [Methanococcus maripaludis]
MDKDYSEVSPLIHVRSMTKLSNLLISLCPGEEKETFVQLMSEKTVMRDPTKEGFILQTMKDNEKWVRFVKAKEIKRLGEKE